MTTTNPITGDKIQSKPNTKAYRDNWENIYGKKETPKPSQTDEYKYHLKPKER